MIYLLWDQARIQLATPGSAVRLAREPLIRVLDGLTCQLVPFAGHWAIESDKYSSKFDFFSRGILLMRLCLFL